MSLVTSCRFAYSINANNSTKRPHARRKWQRRFVGWNKGPV